MSMELLEEDVDAPRLMDSTYCGGISNSADGKITFLQEHHQRNALPDSVPIGYWLYAVPEVSDMQIKSF